MRQQVHQQFPPPRLPPASFAPSANLASSHALCASQALFAFANSAVSTQSGLLLPSLPPLPLSPTHAAPLHSHLQYSQSAPRIVNTVVVPAESQLGTTSALHAVAPVVATQPVALQPLANYQYGTPSMQPISQAGAPVVYDTHLAPQVKASLTMGAQAVHEGVHEVVCTQLAFDRGAQYVTRVPAALQVGAPLAMGAQPALPLGAQSLELAAD